MKMILELVLLAVGFALLIKGADIFVEGASGVAALFGIPELIIGLTVVAMGTSAPEAAVSIAGALKGSADIAIGNVVGSNLLNILFVLGLTAVIAPVAVAKSTRNVEIPFLIVISGVFLFFSNKGYISRLEGVALWILFIGYLTYTVIVAIRANGGTAESEEGEQPKEKVPVWKLIVFILAGIGMIMIGSDVAVDAASAIAAMLGVSKRIIALTVVALGTSLPELFTSLTAARKGNADIAIGNLVGSNIFNYLFIIGTSALILPVPFDEKFILDSIIVVAAEALLLVLVWRKQKLSRVGGGILLLCYAAYFVNLIR